MEHTSTRTAVVELEDWRSDPRDFCRFCGEPVARNPETGMPRLICAPADASSCLDRQERERAAMTGTSANAAEVAQPSEAN